MAGAVFMLSGMDDLFGGCCSSRPCGSREDRARQTEPGEWTPPRCDAAPGTYFPGSLGAGHLRACEAPPDQLPWEGVSGGGHRELRCQQERYGGSAPSSPASRYSIPPSSPSNALHASKMETPAVPYRLHQELAVGSRILVMAPPYEGRTGVINSFDEDGDPRVRLDEPNGEPGAHYVCIDVASALLLPPKKNVVESKNAAPGADAKEVRFEVVVGEDVQDLGLSLATRPRVVGGGEDYVVERVTRTSWAHFAGLARGDKLLELHGLPVDTINSEILTGLIKSMRPLRLKFARGGGHAVAEARGADEGSDSDSEGSASPLPPDPCEAEDFLGKYKVTEPRFAFWPSPPPSGAPSASASALPSALPSAAPSATPSEAGVEVTHHYAEDSETLDHIYSIFVDKFRHPIVGLVARKGKAKDTLFVVEVKEGLVQEWNRAQPRLAVHPGDRIVDVNGVHGDSDSMLKELGTAECMCITFARQAPIGSIGAATFVKANTGATGATQGTSEFVPGEAVEVADGATGTWRGCRVFGPGSLPGTWDIRIPGQDAIERDVPRRRLRRWLSELHALSSAASEAASEPFNTGDAAEVLVLDTGEWSPCKVLGRGAAPGSVEIVVASGRTASVLSRHLRRAGSMPVSPATTLRSTRSQSFSPPRSPFVPPPPPPMGTTSHVAQVLSAQGFLRASSGGPATPRTASGASTPVPPPARPSPTQMAVEPASAAVAAAYAASAAGLSPAEAAVAPAAAATAALRAASEAQAYHTPAAAPNTPIHRFEDIYRLLPGFGPEHGAPQSRQGLQTMPIPENNAYLGLDRMLSPSVSVQRKGR